MKNLLTPPVKNIILFISLSLFSIKGFCQNNVIMTLSNPSSTSATLEFDIFITNNGSGAMSLSGAAFGVNFNTAILNGGSPGLNSFSYMPTTMGAQPSTIFTASDYNTQFSNNQLRFTAINIMGNSMPMVIGTSYKLGRFKFTNTVAWATNADPALSLQLTDQIGKTQSQLAVVLPSSSYIILLPGAQGALTGVVNTPTFFPNATSDNTNICIWDSYTWNGVTYTESGVYTYTSLNASNGVNTSTLVLQLTCNTISATACDSYTLNGTTYTASGVHISASNGLPEACTAYAFIPGCIYSEEYISNVKIGSIDNNSTCDNSLIQYQDFTSLYTTVYLPWFPGAQINYPISVKNGTSFAPDQITVWVDWYHNGFAGPFGTYNIPYTHSLVGPSVSNGFITVPSNALIGRTRMRVRLNYTGIMDPCGTTLYGEVEDYTLLVNTNNPCPYTTLLNLTIHPIPVISSVISYPHSDCIGGGMINPCNGGVTVYANNGTAPYTGLLTPGNIPVAVNASTTGICAGTYTITVTDANGCTATTTVVVGLIPACTDTNVLVINTGYNPVTNMALNYGDIDNLWSISEVITAGNPQFLTSSVTNVTPNGNQVNNPNYPSNGIGFITNVPPGTRIFRRKFKTSINDQFMIDIHAGVDDYIAQILIDDLPFPHNCNQPSQYIFNCSSTLPHYLSAGTHTLDVYVNNINIGPNPTGINLYGTITGTINSLVSNTSPDSCCCATPPCNADFVLDAIQCAGSSFSLSSNPINNGLGYLDLWEVRLADPTCNSNNNNPVFSSKFGSNVTFSPSDFVGMPGNCYRVTHKVYYGANVLCTESHCFCIANPILSATITQPTCIDDGIIDYNTTGFVSVTSNPCPDLNNPNSCYVYSYNPTGPSLGPIEYFPAGTYTLTGTDAHGCTSTLVETLVAPQVPTINITSIGTTTCEGGGFTMLWTSKPPLNLPMNQTSIIINPTPMSNSNFYNNAPSNGGFSFAIPMPGTYTVTVIDAYGCSSSSIVIIPPPHDAAIHFKGNSTGLKDYVSIPSNPSNNLTTQNFTIEAWVKLDVPQSGNTLSTILTKRTSNTNGYWIYFNNSSKRFEVRIFGVDYPSIHTFNNFSNCFHVVLTRNKHWLYFYVNGILEKTIHKIPTPPSSTPISLGLNSSPLYLGIDFLSPNNPCHLKGYIDEVRFWNKFNMQKNTNCAIRANKPYLMAYYRFDEGSPTSLNTSLPNTIYDASINGYNGVLHNSDKNGTLSNWVSSCVHCCYPLMQNIIMSCDAYTWLATGITYTASGIYFSPTDTLNLTVLQPTYSSSTVTFTNAFSWATTGATYTASGVYTSTLQNSEGCDSIATLFLTIVPGSFYLDVIEDQPISCYEMSDGAIQATAMGAGNYNYTITNPSLPAATNTYGYFTNLEVGYHTVCATDMNPPYSTVCNIIGLMEPDPLSILFEIDSIPSCGGTNGAISAILSGGTNNLQSYLTWWTNGVGDTINDMLTNNYATSIDLLSAGTYHLSIEDDHGCFAFDSIDLQMDCTPPSTTLNITCYFQGYWDGNNVMSPVLANQGISAVAGDCDTITVELHDANTPYNMMYSTQTMLHQNGTATCSFPSLSGNYYITIKHRNAIATWSANPITFSSITNYDFSTDANKAYGSNQVEVSSGVWAFYSGDVNQDENVDLLDITTQEIDINNFQFGYLATDINGDGNVDLLDIPIVETNINNFIFSVHP